MNHKIKLTTPEEICKNANSIKSELKHNEPKRKKRQWIISKTIKTKPLH